MADFGGLLRGQVHVLRLQVAHQPGHGAPRPVNRIDVFQDFFFGGGYGCYLGAQGHLQGLKGVLIIGVGHGRNDLPVFPFQGQTAVFL